MIQAKALHHYTSSFLSAYCKRNPIKLTMGKIAGTHKQKMRMKGSNEVVKEKWAKHYGSNQRILLVGEGDFSFALSLAKSFGSASNIVATCIDSYDFLIMKYKRAKRNLEKLHNFGAKVVHGVNAIKMKNHADLQMQKFDRIVFNFPRNGDQGKESDDDIILGHKNLVQSFMWNARFMLSPKGEIHVTHKTTYPYTCWNIEELAIQCGLTFVECAKFKIEDYPGYNNKRGYGRNPDDPFPLGKCSTFRFMVSSNATKSPPEFPYQTELKNTLAAGVNPIVEHWVEGFKYVISCLIPDLSDFPVDLEPSSSRVGTTD